MKLINQIWLKYDTDNSGELDYKQTKKYVKQAIGNISDEIFIHVFNMFDNDNSGSIDKHEMIDFMNMINQEAEVQTKSQSTQIKNSSNEQETETRNKEGLKPSASNGHSYCNASKHELDKMSKQ